MFVFDMENHSHLFLIYLSGLDLGSADSPGPATDGSRRSNLEPEQRGQGGYTRREPGPCQIHSIPHLSEAPWEVP